MALDLRVAVCAGESERKEIERVLDRHLGNMPNVNGSVKTFLSVEELFAELGRGVTFDLLILDADEHQFSVFEIHSPRFLAKPLLDAQVKTLLSKTVNHRHREKEFHRIHGKEGLAVVEFEEILFVENVARAPVYHLRDGTVISGICNRGSFEKALGDICEREEFVQPHKSFFVNMKYATVINHGYIKLKNGQEIPVSRERMGETRSRYEEFLLKISGNSPSVSL